MESKWSLDTIFHGKVTCDKCLAFKICVRLSQQLSRACPALIRKSHRDYLDTDKGGTDQKYAY